MGATTSTINTLRSAFKGNYHGDALHLFAQAGHVVAIAMFATAWYAWNGISESHASAMGVYGRDEIRAVIITVLMVQVAHWVLAWAEAYGIGGLAGRTWISMPIHGFSLFAFLMTFGLYGTLLNVWSHDDCNTTEWNIEHHCYQLHFSWYSAMAFMTLGIACRFAGLFAIKSDHKFDQPTVGEEIRLIADEERQEFAGSKVTMRVPTLGVCR